MAGMQEIGVGKDQLRGNPAVFEQVLGAVGVRQNLFQQTRPLNQAGLQTGPFPCGEGQRNHFQGPGGSPPGGVVKGVVGGPVFVAHAPDPVLALLEYIGSRGIQRRNQRLPVFTGACRRQKCLSIGIAGQCNRVEHGRRCVRGECRVAKVCLDHTTDASCQVYRRRHGTPRGGFTPFTAANQGYMENRGWFPLPGPPCPYRGCGRRERSVHCAGLRLRRR